MGLTTLRTDNSRNLEYYPPGITSQSNLIIASNRGPVEYHSSDDGILYPKVGSGGLVTALLGAKSAYPFSWISAAMSDGDREIAAEHSDSACVSIHEERLQHRIIEIPDHIYEKYYTTACNSFIWFFHHKLFENLCKQSTYKSLPDVWVNGYLPANKKFAEAIVSEIKSKPSPTVLIQDYHLFLVPWFIRQLLPLSHVSHVQLQHFTHIPWPEAKYWTLVPKQISTMVLRSLCSCDIVGLQTKRDVDNFLATCEELLPESKVDYTTHTVYTNGNPTLVKAYPISIDVPGIRNFARSLEVEEYKKSLAENSGEKTLVRVDRLDPAKNIVKGFEAFDMLLEHYPQLIGKVKFMSFLVPSRAGIKDYQQYAEIIWKLVDSINYRYKTDGWEPITIFYEHNYAQAIAAMQLYDALLVNSLADGMNLVSKEGPTVNEKNGVLILSKEAGSFEQLGSDSIPVDPADRADTMHALYKALQMSDSERSYRSAKLKTAISNYDITRWLNEQVNDLTMLNSVNSIVGNYKWRFQQNTTGLTPRISATMSR